MDDKQLYKASTTAPSSTEEGSENKDRSHWRSYIELSFAIVGGVLSLVFGCVFGMMFLSGPLISIPRCITAVRRKKLLNQFDTVHPRPGYAEVKSVRFREGSGTGDKDTYYGTFTYNVVDEAGQSSVRYRRELESEWLYSRHQEDITIAIIPGYPGSGHPLKVVEEMVCQMEGNRVFLFIESLISISFGYFGYLAIHWGFWVGGGWTLWLLTILSPMLAIPELAARDYRRTKDNLLNGAEIDECSTGLVVSNLLSVVQAEKGVPCEGESLPATEISQEN